MESMLDTKEKIFIAGGTGMVGSAIKRAFEEYNSKNKELKLSILAPTRKELNLYDYAQVKSWFKKNKPSIVILAAAKVGGIYANKTYPVDFLIKNLKIQNNIIENAFSQNIKRLLFLGSSCIYPKFSKQPIKEEYLLTGALEKTNEFYAIAKIAGLKLCESLRSQYNFDAISLMPTNLYGPNDNYHSENSHVVASLIRKFSIAKLSNLSKVTCWGTGKVRREFMHVDDLADAIIFCLTHWNPNDINSPKDSFGYSVNHLNVGTGKDITIKELANLIAELTNFKGRIEWDTSKPDGTPRKKLDTSLLKNLGWESKINLKNGLISTIKNLDISTITN